MRPTSTRLTSIVVLLVFAVSLATAAQVGKVPRIGVLLPGSPGPEYERRLDAFRQGLRELGYIDTQNILLGSEGVRTRSSPDSPLEQSGFELMVPPRTPAFRARHMGSATAP